MPNPRDVDTELRDSAIFSIDDDWDPWPEEPADPDTTPPDVAFMEPAVGLQVALGTSVAFKFRATDAESGIKSVEWSQDGVNYAAATKVAGVASTWSANVTVGARGNITVWVRATDGSWNTRVVSRTVVGFDAKAPELVVVSPGLEVTDAPMKLVAKARDTDPTSGVKAVRWSLNASPFQDASLNGEIDGWPAWRADIPIPVSVPRDGTPYTLVVRAYNYDDQSIEETLAIKAVDRSSPKLEISEPQDGAEIPGTSSGATVKVRGTASDTHNGTTLYSGIERVEWNLDNRAYTQATPKAPADWSSWSVDVPIPAQDQHTITVRCLDKQGNPPNPLPRKVVAALPFEVKDFGPRSYLKDLLDFAARRLKRVGGISLSPRLLTSTFNQPFEALVSSTSEAAAQPIHQIRLCIEVLRDFLPGYVEPRPLARWGFDEGSGTTAQDASGNGNVGTLQGPTRVAGKVGTGALAFDGVDDVVRLGGEASNRDVTNDFSVAFWANPQTTHEIDAEGTSGTAGTSGQRYAIDPQQGGTAYGSPDHACAGVSVGTNGISVYEHSDGYMPPLLVHQAAVSGWTHVVVVYENRRPRLYLNGVLAKTGLPSPKSFVHLNPQTIGGMVYGYFRGQLDDVRLYDRVLSPAEVRGLISPASTGEFVWVEDNLPAGAVAQSEGGVSWSWVTSDPAPFSGTRALRSAIAAGRHRHYFTTTADAMAVNRGDRLFAYVYLDPANVPEEVMLQWNAGADGGWEHRAYWGANKITDWGTDGTESRRYMGPLPPAGRWVRLEVPANQVGLEGRVVGGVAFALYGGRATWDRAGKAGYRVELDKAEAGYRRAAYLELLSRIGTSYEEIRLSRAATEGARKALADRLGITLSPTRPDQLDRLLLQPEQATEADLERLFGLRATTRAPLDPGAVAEPEVLSWQKEYLRTLWKNQDRAGGAGTPPIIDPDLIGPGDLANPLPGNVAFDLWNARSRWVAAQISDLRSRRASKTTPLEGFDYVVGGVLTTLNLTALAEDRAKGVNIEPKLKEKQVSLAAFDYLVRVRNLAAAGSVLPSEWEDVYAILAQVLKLRAWEGVTGWRAEERLKNLSLGPDHFKPSPATDMHEELLAWRATRQARSTWRATLLARIDQRDSTIRALQAAVDATEETTLPLLRDALVAAVGAGRTDRDVAEDLTQRLLIDVKNSGQLRTTRTNQAVETLQGILFSLRTGRFKERASALGPNPAAGWVLDQREAYKEEQFDQEYRWMGSYDTWRAAMFVFLYPENVLLPGLREDPTPGAGEKDPTDAFTALISNLRSRPGLTPEGARTEAKAYLTALKADPAVSDLARELESPEGWSGPFEITDQLDEARLRLRASFVTKLWDNPNLQTAQVKTYLREVFYFVPLQLALQLQQAGQYLTALDWFQTVYAYDLPAGQRKIYDALKLDPATPSTVNRTVEWLLQSSLNPHRIASTRKDAYTRFTLLSLARCFVEFADAEFTRATDESIPRARTLYANALDLLSAPEMQQAPTAGNFPQNPVPGSVRLRAELNLFKLRTGRNIAGLQRQVESTAVAGSTDGLPALDGAGRPVARAVSALRPTSYYYSVLIERAKHLAGISQQIEAAYLSALERTDAENYGLLQAGHDLDLAQEGVELQKLKEREATDGEELARRQQDRTQVQVDTYAGWIGAGFNQYENAMVQNYKDMRAYRNTIAGIDAAITTAQAFTTALSGEGWGLNAGTGMAALVGALSVGRARSTMGLNNVETQAQINSLNASHERRKQEWELQKSLAEKDLLIGLQQMQLAQDRVRIVEQEYDIARIQADQAKSVADFLANKFTNAELYEWMSGILAGVYGYFLQQATAVALLAQHQLTFERQETPPSFVQADYWQPPAGANGSAGSPGEEATDRRGMTGSARLLQDVYRLDQYAFETNERKLQLSQTFSLARTFPLEFQDFRRTGRMPFATPMEMFDRVFPGHYLRLIRRVRTSVVALVPPTHGIKATLQTSGISRVVSGRHLRKRGGQARP